MEKLKTFMIRHPGSVPCLGDSLVGVVAHHASVCAPLLLGWITPVTAVGIGHDNGGL